MKARCLARKNPMLSSSPHPTPILFSSHSHPTVSHLVGDLFRGPRDRGQVPRDGQAWVKSGAALCWRQECGEGGGGSQRPVLGSVYLSSLSILVLLRRPTLEKRAWEL